MRNRTRRGAGATAAEPLAFTDELEHPTAGTAETPHDRLARREATEAWAARLLALPERYRAPIVLHHVDGLGYDEIAVALGRPEGTVKTQVHRGLALLRAAIAAETADRRWPQPLVMARQARRHSPADLRPADARPADHFPAPPHRPKEAVR